MSVVIKDVGYIIVHAPDFVRYGSKPSRDLLEDNGLLERIKDHLRTYEEALNYPPHQVFIGNIPLTMRNEKALLERSCLKRSSMDG
jgi:hypothetical protein